MSSRSHSAAVIAAFILYAGTVHAGEFPVFGPRALSVGGAATAASRTPYAPAANPASLADPAVRGSGVVFLGGGIRDVNLAEHLDVLVDYDWDAAVANPTGPDAAAIVAEILRVDSGDCLMMSAAGGFILQIGSFGMGVVAHSEAVGNAIVDRQRVHLSSPADPLSFAYNDSAIQLRGIALAEVPLALARRIPLGSCDLDVGAAVKYMHGVTYNGQADMTTDADDLRDLLDDFDKATDTVGLDLGAVFRPPAKSLSLGLVARNVNSPSFDTVTGEEFEEKAQVRAGLAYDINPRWTALLDADVTENDTYSPDYSSRWVGGGVDFHTGGGFSARGGLMSNIAENDPGLMATLGLSLGVKKFSLDLGGAFSFQESQMEGSSLSSEIRFSAALQSVW